VPVGAAVAQAAQPLSGEVQVRLGQLEQEVAKLRRQVQRDTACCARRC